MALRNCKSDWISFAPLHLCGNIPGLVINLTAEELPPQRRKDAKENPELNALSYLVETTNSSLPDYHVNL
jgi:hypothetical protein